MSKRNNLKGTNNKSTSGSNSSHQGRKFNHKTRNTGKSIKAASYDERYSEDAKADSRNDIGWYTASPNLLAAAASLPYNHLTGTITYRGGFGGDSHTHYSAPGAIQLRVVPGPGFAASPSDPVNVAANAIYSYVRHQNSGHANYDAPDLMMYLLAMDSAFTYLTWLQRIYGTIHMYSAVNRYTPKDLIELQGVDYEDLVSNIAQFRYGINAAITRMGSFCVPNNMPIFARHASLFGNYYIEGDSFREQMYMYTPQLVYKFELNEVDGFGELVPQFLYENNTSPLLKVKDLLTIFEDMINAIAYDEDMNIMSGDILKAYGTDRLLTLSLIPEMYVCMPQRNFEILEQFQNSACYGLPAEESLIITQDLDDMNGRIRYLPKMEDRTESDPSWTYRTDVYSRNKLLTTSNTNPTPEINMLNTRMIPALQVDKDAETMKTTNVFFKVGSELPVQYTIMYYTQTGADPTTKTRVISAFETYVGGNLLGWSTFSKDAIVREALVASFKFAPEITVIAVDQNNNEDTQIYPSHFQLDTYTTVDHSILERLHEAALLGEWNVERLAIAK